MRCLVTGCCGFLGINLLDKLKKHDIVGIDKDPRYQPPKDILFLKYDLNDISEYQDTLTDVNTVYHLAASADIRRSGRDPWWDFKDNVRATINVLELMRKKDIPEIVFISSSAVYGVQNGILTEESPFKPISLYGASKATSESYVHTYAERFGLKTTVFRPAQIVGSYEHRGVIVDFFHKLRKNPKKLEILGDGKQTKSYFHVDDCVRAILDLRGDIYNLSNLGEISVTELAKMVVDELPIDKDVKFEYTGGTEGWSDGRGWPDDTPFYHVSIMKAIFAGWRPKYDCEESIRKTVRWLYNYHSDTNKK